MIEVEGKIDNQPITILIDYGDSHSYIDLNMVDRFKLKRCKHEKSWLVHLATETKRKNNEFVKYCVVNKNDYIAILIDYGDSHSYIDLNKVDRFKLKGCKHEKSWLIHLATETKRRNNEFVKDCVVNKNGVNTKSSLKIISLGLYDCLIGMDWLDKHHATLVCYNKAFTRLDEKGIQIHFKLFQGIYIC
jgi:hypothetical protein